MNFLAPFLLILISSIYISCQSKNKNSQNPNWDAKQNYCKVCLDSCQMIKNKKSDLAPLFFNKNLLHSFNQKTLLDTISYHQELTLAAKGDSLRSTKLRFASREGWIEFDTIYNHLIRTYSDKINTLDRKMYAASEMTKNKIQIHFTHYNPSDYYTKQDTLEKRGNIEGVINKNLLTNEVEEIRILIDSIEYVLDASNIKQAIR